MFGDAEPPDPVDLIRRTIAGLDDQRKTAAAAAGAALANQAQAERALREQLLRLTRSRTELERTLHTAQDAARAEAGGADADAYEATVGGTRSALDVVGGAIDQLGGLHAAARTNVDRARTMLTAARTALDDALRDQIRLLREVEQSRREDVVARARAARGGRTDPQAPGRGG